MFTRKVKKGKEIYVLTYDEYRDLDTVTRERDGKAMHGGQAVVKFFVNNADGIFNMKNIKGIEYV